MKQQIRSLFSFAICVLALSSLAAQELPTVIPPNPEVASLGKYTDIPVGSHTGVPNISVPLVQLSGKSTTIPVGISYHASGIRVGEMASRVGLGWNLSVGGAINRSVRGIPDDDVDGFLNPIISVADFLALEDQDKQHYMFGVHGNIDLESDTYTLNFQGESGEFFFDKDGQLIVHPRSDIKIQAVKNGGIRITGWIVTALNGTKYYLGTSKDGTRQANDTSSTSSITTNETTIPVPQIQQPFEDYITSWKLMDIETIDHKLTSFYYDFANISFWSLTGQEREIPSGNPSSAPTTTSYSLNNETTHRITSVVNDRGSVEFTYGHPREDLKSDRALTNITLKDLNGKTIDAYILSYGYFISTAHPSNLIIGDLDQRRKRLYLKGVRQVIEEEENKIYAFEYNTSNILPDRFSFSQDFWGYYNGRTNGFLYPEIEWTNDASGLFQRIPGGDRKVDSNFAKACMLTKITYPTGGYTEYEFESNKIGNVGFFGLARTEEEVIDGLNTANSSATFLERTVTINDPSEYVGGIGWSVDLNSCTEGSLSCSLAEIYKVVNGVEQLLFSTSEANLYRGIVFDASQPLTLRLKLYNNSGVLDPADREDVRTLLIGRKLVADSENAIDAGGLRIKHIGNFDHNGALLLQKDFAYELFDNPTTTSGAALNPPTFIYRNIPVCSPSTGDGINLHRSFLRSNSIFPLTNGSSYTTSYTNVTEYSGGGSEGKDEYTFSFTYDGDGVQTNIYEEPNTPLQDFSHRRGLLLKKSSYSRSKIGANTYTKVWEQINTYNPFGENLLDWNVVTDTRSCGGTFSTYQNLSERFYQTAQRTTTFYDTGDLSSTMTYTYEPGYSGRTFPVATRLVDSRGHSVTTNSYFPGDIPQLGTLPPTALSAAQELQIQNRIATPLQEVVTVRDAQDNVLSENKTWTFYRNWGNGLVFPEWVRTSKDGSAPDDRIRYHGYDDQGNPLEVSIANGPSISYIWGYDGEYPIAKIENATYSELSSFVPTLKTRSGADNDRTLGSSGKEGLLRQALDNLRSALPKALVTTYTYDPMVGMTSGTDPSGYTMFYEYDDFNRLKEQRDNNGLLETEHFYHYKGESITHSDFSIGDIDSSSFVITGENNTYAIATVGGSGNYSYTWTFTHPTASTITRSGETVNLALPNDFLGTMTVQVSVRDNTNGNERTRSKQVEVHRRIPPGNVQSSKAYIDLGPAQHTFSVTPQHGSGSFRYAWSFVPFGGNTTAPVIGSATFTRSFESGFNSGSITARCEITDRVTGQQITYTKNFSAYAPLHLGNISPNTTTVEANGATTYTVVPSGGSGDFSYDWTFDGESDILFENAESQVSPIFTAAHHGNMNIRVTVTDHITGATDTSILDNITIVGPLHGGSVFLRSPIQAPAEPHLNFTTFPSGGSGNYSYLWKITRPDGAPLSNYSSQNHPQIDLEILPSMRGDIVVFCTVTDIVTEKMVDSGRAFSRIVLAPGDGPGFTPFEQTTTITNNTTTTLLQPAMEGDTSNLVCAWYVDYGNGNGFVETSSDPTLSLSLPCGDIAQVKCIVTDTLTGATSERIEAITSNCN